jgi:anti-anti-sigma factor
MEIQKYSAGDSCELIISGRIAGDGADQLDAELSAIVFGKVSDNEQMIKTIYVNLSGATFLGSAGVGHLMRYRLTMRRRGGQLLVTRPSPEATEVLKLVELYDLIVEKH